jgi:hypothetical protein
MARTRHWIAAALAAGLLGGCSWDDAGDAWNGDPAPAPALALRAATLDVMGFERNLFASGAPFRVRAILRNEGDAAATLLLTGRSFDAWILAGDSLVASAAEGCVDTSHAETVRLEPGGELDFNWLAPDGLCGGDVALPAGDYTVRVESRVDVLDSDQISPRELDLHIVP